jgi:hypothetical protein
VSAEPVLDEPFPFDGDLHVVPLNEPVIPESPRNGDPVGDGATSSGACAPDSRRIRAEEPADGGCAG